MTIRVECSVHPIEHDPTSRLRKQVEAGDTPVNVGLENQSAKVAGVELVWGTGVEDDRRLFALLDRQSSLLNRQRVDHIELIRVVPAGEPG